MPDPLDLILVHTAAKTRSQFWMRSHALGYNIRPMDNDGVPDNRHGISYFLYQGLQELDDARPPKVRVVFQHVMMPAQPLALWADADGANHRNSAMRVADLIDRRRSWGCKGAPDSGSHHEASLIYEDKMVS
jgi:hypothetical protein